MFYKSFSTDHNPRIDDFIPVNAKFDQFVPVELTASDVYDLMHCLKTFELFHSKVIS